MEKAQLNERLRGLPQVEVLLQHPLVEQMQATLPRAVVVDVVRGVIDDARRAILAGSEAATDADSLIAAAFLSGLRLQQPSLRRVVNASGVIVHTNLGRSPMATSAVQAVHDVAAGYSTLEYDSDNLCRGSRHMHCEQLICALTGAEAAIAVNNNAAAVMMVLTEFAAGREAIVSRGELVEIGGSFRIPDVMRTSGAHMVEVGTTNKTHLADYSTAMSADTAMLLKVHPSNYRMMGFTESVALRDLHRLAAAENEYRREEGGAEVLVYEDQGSGSFVRLDAFGEFAEPTVAESLRAGADLVSFSGDKLLGGPQAGIIVGRRELIERLKVNPLARVLRLDKMTLAALEATLRLYLDTEVAKREIPTLRMICEPIEAIEERAAELSAAIEAAVPKGCCSLSIEPEVSRCGGGALPMCDIETRVVRVAFSRGNALECERYLVQQREVPVIGRIKNEALLLDVRTLMGPADVAELAAALKAYFTHLK